MLPNKTYCYLVLHRKLMNRVAAQNARDRKRLYLESLEKKVADLEAQVRRAGVEKEDLHFCSQNQ